jgi:hypothetical protein
MKGSIIGEPTERYVIDQVKSRQKIYGKGIDGNSARTTQDIQYMNNRNAWIKMASSVLVENANLRLPKGISNVDSFTGDNLAKKAILFNGLSSLTGGLLGTFGDSSSDSALSQNINQEIRDGKHSGTLQQRSGVELVKNSYFNNSAYGLGGTQFGIQPMPGINSLQVDTKNRGSIKTVTVELVAFNRFQFELIETLYLRLGFCMLIEWGWDRYIDSEGKFQSVKSTVLENGFFNFINQDTILEEINSTKAKYEGNYGGFFGRVVNFNWSFQSDGSYKISIKLTGLGDVIESLKINQSPSKELKESLQGLTHKRFKLLEEAKSAIFNNKASTKLGAILYKKLNLTSIWENGGNGSYFNLYTALKNSEYSDIIGNKGTSAIDLKYAYYIRFGELCNIIGQNIVPDVNSTIKHIKFDGDVDNVICSYQPNLISFDPKVCIIKMDDGLSLNQGSIAGIYNPDYTKSLKPFVHKISSNGTKENRYYITYKPQLPNNAPGPVLASSVISYGPFDKITRTYSPSPGTSAALPNNGTFESEAKVPNNIKDGDLLYGKIYNIYLNYDMIFKLLKNNVDKKGNLTFYKFLQGICDEINSAFSNAIDIEPIIKEDKTITFLDQKPIMGLSKKLSSFGIEQSETAEIEVYGFNKSTLEGTFLKNISFNTKISSKISNQLSIGATANGVAVGEDSTGYSNWNRGLVDRFQQTIEDNTDEDNKNTSFETDNDTDKGTAGSGDNGEVNDGVTGVMYKGSIEILAQIAKDKVVPASRFEPNGFLIKTNVPLRNDVEPDPRGGLKFVDYYHGKKGTVEFSIDKDGNVIGGQILISNGIITDPKTYVQTIYPMYGTLKDFYGIRGAPSGTFINDNKTALEKAFLIGFAEAYGVTLDESQIDRVKTNGFFSTPKTQLVGTANEDLKKEERKRLKKLVGMNYSGYLAAMFGGLPTVSEEQEVEAGIKGKFIPKIDSLYPFREGEGNFASSGKSAYKIYLNEESKANYDNGKDGSISPSNQIGLIPVEFDMEMDGIEGFKIYNKININQRFLPTNYGESLDFLIKGVNHKIDSNGWSTNLQTLSTSNLNAVPVKQNQPTTENPPITQTEETGTTGTTEGTPNADRLRVAIRAANFIEKGSELSNGGDITSNAADLGISLIKTVKEQLPGIVLRFTGGNDRYHQNLSYNSRHKRGNALDFTIIPFNTINKDQVLRVIQGFAAGNNPKVRYKDEYKELTVAATGAHFHVSWGEEGNEGLKELAEALKRAQKGEIETYTV